MADENAKARQVVKVSLTNNDVGPRFVNTLRGQETVMRGATLDTEVNGFQLEALDHEFVHDTDDVPRWGVAVLSGDLQPAGDRGEALTSFTVVQLRAVAEAEGVALTGRTDPTTGEALPDLTKKDDTIAAIQAKRDAPSA